MSGPGSATGSGDARTVREVVPGSLDGERIDRVVAMFTGVSRSEATDLVRSGAVEVDETVVRRGADRLTVGATIAIDLPPGSDDLDLQPDPGVDVKVIHADESILVVDKAPGLVVHPGAGHPDATMVQGLLAVYPEIAEVGEATRPGIVHRLDRGTSGLLVVARTADAYRSLVGQLASRTVERRYRSVVWGHLESERGVVDAPIGRSARHPTKMAVTERGKPARTRYEVIDAFAGPVPVSELVCHLETGRTHQIRVHLAAIGHPVLGDARYGGGRQSLPCPRPYLHAEHLAFDHPATGNKVEFDSELPTDLREIRAKLS